jgi:hypothetical protein
MHTSDAKTIKARKRMAMLIVDQTGFLHCINVTTALITLQSVPV